ncbi:MAG: (deoxy)nucleoside triphosphate pyrophosphohydrolase [Clostridia bacterium]|nr:(deoxy)nucleoside triphosphate pyrophosphohydrolase [Clostridia bacterium]
MKTTEVVAALIRDGGKFLICRRPASKARGLMWEFVGGKVEDSETKEAALVRECREELDIEVSVYDEFCSVTHEYPDITVHLTVFYASIKSGTPRLIEHTEMKWITPDETGDYDFCPADRVILDKIKGEK